MTLLKQYHKFMADPTVETQDFTSDDTESSGLADVHDFNATIEFAVRMALLVKTRIDHGGIRLHKTPKQMATYPAFGAETQAEQPTPPTEHIMQFFAYAHLKPELRDISAPFGDLAELIVHNIPRNPERTVALRKLLEAKDAAVRAFIAG